METVHSLNSERPETPLVQQGTYTHPDIAIQFAQWCSPGFALWVSRQIRHLLTYGEVNIHHTEWIEEEILRGHQYNADDVREIED